MKKTVKSAKESWNVAARSCRATARDREECAAREVAHRGGCEGTGSEKIDLGGGAVEQEGTDGEGDEEQEVDRA